MVEHSVQKKAHATVFWMAMMMVEKMDHWMVVVTDLSLALGKAHQMAMRKANGMAQKMDHWKVVVMDLCLAM